MEVVKSDSVVPRTNTPSCEVLLVLGRENVLTIFGIDVDFFFILIGQLAGPGVRFFGELLRQLKRSSSVHQAIFVH